MNAHERNAMTAQTLRPFHLAFPVTSLSKARAFYGDLLGCPEGRSSDEWVDFDLYGHQIVAHLAPQEAGLAGTNAVDGDNVPVRHFGVVLPMDEWQALSERLAASGVKFIIEFKAFADLGRLFSK
jgi:extradiol dioxygenase family protein